jgi:acetyltransferase-like isoleucine patch superfamily enzyme
MLKAFLFCVGFLPSFLQKPLRRLCGASIGPGAVIRPFSFILTPHLHMGDGARIGPFVFAKVRKLTLGRQTVIEPLVLINCTYGPRSELKIGKMSRVHSFSVLEPSEGIFIGDQVALGGQCLIFCHASWSNYLKGATYSTGPVHIEDEVWIAWRAMIVAGTHIGARATVGAHTLVSGKIPPNSLYLGVPGRMVLDQVWKDLSLEDKRRRLLEICDSFHAEKEVPVERRIRFCELGRDNPQDIAANEDALIYSFSTIDSGVRERIQRGPKTALVDLERQQVEGGSPLVRLFLTHLASYGVRLEDPTR